jgi:hypothetical protein
VIRDVRDAAKCGLRDAITAVNWAIGQHNARVIGTNGVDIDRFRVASAHGWVYEFPNGHSASVINDPSRPFHFEIMSASLNVTGGVTCGLTTKQVEVTLRNIATLPTR